jgi:hypothetical protein
MTGILPHAKLDRFDLIILGDLPYMRRDQTETSMLFELTAERCCCRNAANNVRSLKRQFPQTIIFNGLQAFTETTGTGFGVSVDVLTLYRTGIETAMAFQSIVHFSFSLSASLVGKIAQIVRRRPCR